MPEVSVAAGHETPTNIAVRTVWSGVMPTVGMLTVGAGRSPEAAGGTTAADGADAAPVPTEFVAVTVNVYETPLVSPFTVQLVALEVAHVRPSGDEVAA